MTHIYSLSQNKQQIRSVDRSPDMWGTALREAFCLELNRIHLSEDTARVSTENAKKKKKVKL